MENGKIVNDKIQNGIDDVKSDEVVCAGKCSAGDIPENCNDFDAYLLDLDGTLTDSKPGILNCVKHALSAFDVPIPDDKFLNNLIGPPLAQSFRKYFGLTETQAKEALVVYRERYERLGMDESALYPFVVETLKALKEKGKFIALATSKAVFYAKIVLEKFDILQYFDHVQGGDLEGKHCGKTDVVRLCLEEIYKRTGYAKNRCVMVGDRMYDVVGANENGIKCIGVTYGYAEENELESHGVAYKIDSINKLI